MAEDRLDLLPIARKTTTVSTTVVTLDSTLLTARMRKVYVQVDPAGGNVRVTFDGSTDPAGATTGFRYDGGDLLKLTRTEALNAKFIRDAGSDATLQCLAVGGNE